MTAPDARQTSVEVFPDWKGEPLEEVLWHCRELVEDIGLLDYLHPVPKCGEELGIRGGNAEGTCKLVKVCPAVSYLSTFKTYVMSFQVVLSTPNTLK